MTLVTESARSPSSRAFRYLEASAPIVFPESETVPEGQEHFELRTLLYQLLLDTLGDRVTVGSDQFVYLDAEDPRKVLAPDVYVRLSPAAELVRSWKVWERGAPEVAVELVSEDDASEAAWQRKLARYRSLGARELLRFDPRDDERPLRVWDRVEGRLIERETGGSSAPSLVLDLDWVVRPCERLRSALRITRGGVLVPSRKEAQRAEQCAREAAEERVRQLEAELARR